LRLLRATPEKYDAVSEVVLTDPESSGGALSFGAARLLKPPAWAAPILSHGLLYVRGRDRLVCLELIPAEENKKNFDPASGKAAADKSRTRIKP
jgi:hypothetical protein